MDYDKAQGKLKLQPGAFLGKSVHRAVDDEDDTENKEIALAFEDEGNDLAGTTHTISSHIKLEIKC